MAKTSARIFQAKDFSKAVAHKEESGAIGPIRFVHPTLGVCYEVRYLPEIEHNQKTQDKWAPANH